MEIYTQELPLPRAARRRLSRMVLRRAAECNPLRPLSRQARETLESRPDMLK